MIRRSNDQVDLGMNRMGLRDLAVSYSSGTHFVASILYQLFIFHAFTTPDSSGSCLTAVFQP